MPNDARYFELLPELGVHHETGEPEPIREVGVTAAVPRIVKGELVQDVERHVLKPIAGTRILKVTDLAIADALAQSGQYREVEAPDEKALQKARKDTETGEAS